MSLEQALAENTAALNRLATILQSGAILPAGTATATAAPAETAAATTKGTRGKKAEAAAAPAGQAASSPETAGVVAVNDGKSEMPHRLADDPQGTRYFDIPSHRTVAKIKPGEVIPSMPGMEEVNGARYEVCKNTYAAPVPSSGAAPSGGAAAAPASSTPAASSASSPASAQPQPASTTTSSPTLDGPAITAKCQALHKVQGNPGLKQVLDHFGATNVPSLIAKTDKYAEIGAYIDSLLNPPAAAPAAEVNLFG